MGSKLLTRLRVVGKAALVVGMGVAGKSGKVRVSVHGSREDCM